ncbi:MAG: CPBP family intramembrane metalloprotease, partial [Hyphomicrobiales bacterium]|nr:CPBP family intramembrane metalloprotease [Hyphomicrobiales bacterium]
SKAAFWTLAALGEAFAFALAFVPFSRLGLSGARRALGWVAPPSWKTPLWQVPAALVAYGLWAGAAAWAMTRFLPSLSATPSIVDQISGGLGLLPLMALAVGVLAPIAEESVFRGYLYGRVDAAFGAGWAIGVSALAFSAAHFDFKHHSALQPAIVLGMGIILGLMRRANGGLVPGAIAHATVNCGALAIAAAQHFKAAGA